MRDNPTPTTLLYLPGAASASFVRAFITRDTRNCNLTGDRQLNRFPASTYCAITWFLEGSVRLLSCGGEAQDQPVARCAVSGCQSHPFTSRNCGDANVFMAMFYADAFHALFGIDLARLQNRFLDAQDILPPHGLALVEAVFAAGSHAERQQLIESCIAARAASADLSAWTRIRRMGGRISLAAASALLGIGPRQLQRLALRQAGLNVQTLARLLRGERGFLTAQSQQFAGQAVDLADHAMASDYADQSHMARECKAQTGRTPAQLARDVLTEEADWIYRVEFPNDQDSSPSRSA